jgi:N6-adenosine-specific RNA methylase IME4
MPESEYTGFRDDIARRGIQVGIEITADNVVLDGRQRLRAARELGLATVPVVVVEAAEPVDYMLRAAILRRHLSASQRAAMVLLLPEYEHLCSEAAARQRANLRQSTEVATLPPRGKTRDQAAEWVSVGGRTVQDAIEVRREDPDLFERITRGELSASLAARRVRRQRRDEALPPSPPLPDGRFQVLYADPPWQFGNPDGPHAPEQHYPTMPLDKIRALRVPAADDTVLCLWAVTSLLPEALEVIHAWGFTYKTGAFWVKGSIGPGVWFRNEYEQLLLATRGNWPPPEPEDRVSSVIRAPRRAHSQKPDEVYDLIERMYPHATKLELFARGKPRPGWAAWGNEVER